jgi:hypothetical protein
MAKRRNLGRVVELRKDGEAAVVAELALLGPSGKPLDSARVIGVGERLFFFKDRQVLTVADW